MHCCLPTYDTGLFVDAFAPFCCFLWLHEAQSNCRAAMCAGSYGLCSAALPLQFQGRARLHALVATLDDLTGAEQRHILYQFGVQSQRDTWIQSCALCPCEAPSHLFPSWMLVPHEEHCLRSQEAAMQADATMGLHVPMHQVWRAKLLRSSGRSSQL